MGLNSRLNTTKKKVNELKIRATETKLKYREQKHLMYVYGGQGEQSLSDL